VKKGPRTKKTQTWEEEAALRNLPGRNLGWLTQTPSAHSAEQGNILQIGNAEVRYAACWEPQFYEAWSNRTYRFLPEFI
jgi:hypothetical protein